MLPKHDINSRPFSKELSPWALEAFVDEFKHVPKDSFALPGDAKLRKGDRYFCRGGEIWQETTKVGEPVSCDRFVYIRLIEEDPELHKKMRDYAAAGSVGYEPAPLEDQLAAARAKVAELERKMKENELKDGDWAVVVDADYKLPANGSVVQIDDVRASASGSTSVCDVVGMSAGGYYLSRFRKATPEEVAAHLEKQKIVEVKVDNVVYKSEYCLGYVEFGCAKIDNHFIVALDNWMCSTPNFGNRKIEAVQIGKGLFTANMIAKLAKNLIS